MLTEIFLRFFLWLLWVLPHPLFKFVCWCLSIFWFDIVRIRRKIAIENIAASYPGFSKGEVIKMARKSFYHQVLNFLEFSIFPNLDPNWVDKNVVFNNLDEIDKGLEKGKGVFLLGIHLGNGDLAMACIAIKSHPLYLIARRIKNKAIDKICFQSREQHGVNFIDVRKTTFEIMRRLRKNKVVVFVIDQHMPPPMGVPTLFFGRKASTSNGLALLARKTGAVVIPSCSYRDEKTSKFVIDFLPPVEDDLSKTTEEMTQVYTSIAENMISKRPEQWMWVHRRWKI